MTLLSLSFPQTLSSSSPPLIPRTTTKPTSSSLQTERGIQFCTGSSFYRPESSTARDLAVLSLSIHRLSLPSPHPPIRVLDAMCGCGVRSLRYLSQSQADFVWANDAFEGNRPIITQNLTRAAGERTTGVTGGERRWVVTHNDANRLMTESYLNREYFDLVDVDSFGSDTGFMRSAVRVVKEGGLLYLTSTDGFSSGGHRPLSSLASYGAYVRAKPYSNEVGLRMLIGGALREAAALGYHVSPLFSYYSYHGPIFRVMLQLNCGKLQKDSHYGFIGYCNKCGNSQAISWAELGQICCPCKNGVVSRVVVSGPLWLGPLHDTAFVTDMLKLAGEWKWALTDGKDVGLEKLLNHMINESDPRLPSGYIKLDEIARRAKINSPPLRTLMSALKREGYAVSRSHIAPDVIKTNCPMAVCLQIATELRHAESSNHTAPSPS